MRIIHREFILAKGLFANSEQWAQIDREIITSIHSVVWPPSNDEFVIYPESGKKRGKGSGVVPIKQSCMENLQHLGWSTRDRRNPLRFDAVRRCNDILLFGFEWETGNISSSHRAVNRILRGHKEGFLVGGALVLPTQNLAQYLTDRVGNYEELEPYFDVWSNYQWKEGVLVIYGVEHDSTSTEVPRIRKGTDGRALQ